MRLRTWREVSQDDRPKLVEQWIALRDNRGWTYSEIAAEYGFSYHTVYDRICHMRQADGGAR